MLLSGQQTQRGHDAMLKACQTSAYITRPVTWRSQTQGVKKTLPLVWSLLHVVREVEDFEICYIS